jgi:hypothetical protein
MGENTNGMLVNILQVYVITFVLLMICKQLP